MTKFNITLTMGNGQIEKLALTKSQLAHIFAGPRLSIYKPKLSNDDLSTVISIIKLGIADYANVYHNIKHCTITNRYNNKTIEYDFNTDVTDIGNNNDISLYYYILDASIDYHFNLIKTKLLNDFTIYTKTSIDLIDLSKLRVIVEAIVARLDIEYYNEKFYIILMDERYKPLFEKDDIFTICDCIAHKKNDITWFKVDECLNRILTYFNGTYKPHFPDFHSALERFMQYFDD